MKKIQITLCIILMGALTKAQTNTFPDSGDAGIGTINPASKLHIVHPQGSGVKIETDNTDANTAKLQVLFNYTSTAADRNAIIELGRDIHDGHSYKWRLRANSTYTWGNLSNLYIEYLKTGAYETHMAFTNNGNVGIGTTTPDSKLTVAGKIHAQEIKVTTTAGADFVFEADYPLRSLEETEQFIKENKHLPDIPSAEEMVAEGITLGEMNVKLLQKIEELTLYVIELKKENEQIKKTNNELTKRILKIENMP